jgi:hypothetical protein
MKQKILFLILDILQIKHKLELAVYEMWFKVTCWVIQEEL